VWLESCGETALPVVRGGRGKKPRRSKLEEKKEVADLRKENGWYKKRGEKGISSKGGKGAAASIKSEDRK